MKAYCMVLVLAILAAVQGLPQAYDYGPPQQKYQTPDSSNQVVTHEGMPYDFQWGVQDDETGNSYSHVENSDGRTTQGEYRVLLPDGRTQIVKFSDNGDGYVAEISYEK